MQEENFIVREALLNTQERVVGYELTWGSARAAGTGPGHQQALDLLGLIGQQVSETDGGTLAGEQTIFVEILPSLLSDDALLVLPPSTTVYSLQADAIDTAALDAINALRVRGYGISLRNADLRSVDKTLLGHVTHVETAIGPDFVAQVQLMRALNLPSLRMIARGVNSWQAYDLCAQLGLHAFCGNLHLSVRPDSRARELNPAQTLILELMDMVRKNADVKQLENVIKRDAALSYKLLRYINSAGFGLGCEIQSLRHAVTMLGYSPLYRWLALLLATATTAGYSPVLMQTAVIRGRFAELLGGGFLPRSETENLFVAGMFSLLDRLLGVPMEDVLEKIQLSESVTQALLHREGIYGPFLALAEACELNHAALDDMTTSLCISSHDVNRAQLSALAWAQSLKL